MKNWLSRIIIVSGISVVSACSSIPESIRVEDGTKLVPFADARALPDDTKGEVARWGGVIAEVKNLPEKTVIEVVNMSLSGSARPKISDKTEGRFRIIADGLLDPMIYEKGKHITVLGSVTGSELGMIGDHEYHYPLVKADGIYLWKELKDPVHHLNDPYWHSPFYWHFYSPRYYRLYPRAVLHKPVKTKSKSN